MILVTAGAIGLRTLIQAGAAPGNDRAWRDSFGAGHAEIISRPHLAEITEPISRKSIISLKFSIRKAVIWVPL
jgi:hypothetical protein